MRFLNWVLFLTLVTIQASCNSNINDSKELTFTIDTNTSYQEIEGFGATGAWWAQYVGGWENERDDILELLFSTEKGIGLSIYRYNIGAGATNVFDPWRRTHSLEVEPGVYDWTKDENAIWVALQAQEYGVEQIVAFINSPPPRLTLNNLASGNQQGITNISSDNYQAFAEYGIGITEYLRNEVGLNITALSPINEPQWTWGKESIDNQEGCHYDPEDVIDVLLAYKNEMDSRGINDFILSAPEAGEWSTAMTYARDMFEHEELKDYFDAFDGHSYWSSRQDKEVFARVFYNNFPDKKIHMSEWTEMINGKDTTMSSAFVLANEIHDDLTVLNAVSWQYWIAVSKYDYRDGLVYVSNLSHKITETKRLWAFGNYSRFIRPGFERVEVTETSDPIIKASAYHQDDKLIVVLVNTSASSYELNLEQVLGSQSYQSVHLYETSENHDLELLEDNVKSNRDITINSKSITTLEITLD